MMFAYLYIFSQCTILHFYQLFIKFIEGPTIIYMSRLVGKPTMWFPNRSDTNRPVQVQKQARSLKFWIYKVEELYYPCSVNKGADQLRGYLICVFVFAYADCWFSHEVAHILLLFNLKNIPVNRKNVFVLFLKSGHSYVTCLQLLWNIE